MGQITGTHAAEILYGSNEADRIEGLGGDDTIYSRAGDDHVLGGDGHDKIYSEGGSDHLDGESGNDWFWIAQALAFGQRVVAAGGAGNDEISTYVSGSGGGAVEIAAGEGNDTVRFLGLASSSASLALGQGQDVIRFDTGYFGLGQATVTVADYQVGASGDWIDWDGFLTRILVGWNQQSNPFTSGHLRLTQSGADTLLQVDTDGSSGGGAASTLLTMRNVAAGSLTALNLGGYDPAGGALVGRTINGTSDAESLRGSAGGDVIDGLGGNDRIDAGSGDDTVRGGDGDDSLHGDGGNDRIEGGIGSDTLGGGAGDDQLYGGEGDDLLGLEGGDSAYGEGGNDTLKLHNSSSIRGATAVVSGGDGDDFIEYNYGYGNAAVDAGAGADFIDLWGSYEGNASITLGAGRDTLRLGRSFSAYLGSAVVADFETGPGGDTIDLLLFAADQLDSWDGATNPFSTGHFELLQDGGDTLLQVDPYGEGGLWTGYETLLTLRNTQASALVAADFGGYAPDGTAPAALALAGTDGADTLTGAVGSDLIEGLGGDDRLSGGAGHDTLRGGGANDTLSGDLGNDLLEGGDGADILDGGAGEDRLYGGEGDDRLTTQRGASKELYGEGGNDTLVVSHWGGDGYSQTYNDRIFASGGAGNDLFSVTSYNGSRIVVDGGDGADTLNVHRMMFNASVTATLGEGADTIWLHPAYIAGPGTLTITDFEGGPDGDRVSLQSYLETQLMGWNATSNPFAGGYVALVQDGADVIVRMNQNPARTESTWNEVMRLKNVGIDSLVASNFGGWEPLPTLVAAGTDGDDTLTGQSGRDRIDGGAGNDLFRLEQGGRDSAIGGLGGDQFYYGAAFTGDDSNDGGAGTDVLILQGNYSVTMGALSLVDVEFLSLQSGSSTRYGEAGTASYDYSVAFVDANVAPGQRFTINASQLLAGETFVFDGSKENDGQFLVYGGYGDDRLTGGSSHDMFHFEGSRWGAGDAVDGGAGADALIIRGGSGLTQIAFGDEQVRNMESITVSDRFGLGPAGRPSYDLTLANGNVTSGGTLILNGSTLVDPGQKFDVDGRLVTGGHLKVFSGAGADRIIGGAGNDLLYAAGGQDVLTGGGGADTFQLRSTSDSTVAASDSILDFASGTDKIDLRSLDANIHGAGDQAFQFVGSAAFAQKAGELRAMDIGGGRWSVEGDVNGDGFADFAIQVTLATPQPLAAADFIL